MAGFGGITTLVVGTEGAAGLEGFSGGLVDWLIESDVIILLLDAMLFSCGLTNVPMLFNKYIDR